MKCNNILHYCCIFDQINAAVMSILNSILDYVFILFEAWKLQSSFVITEQKIEIKNKTGLEWHEGLSWSHCYILA